MSLPVGRTVNLSNNLGGDTLGLRVMKRSAAILCILTVVTLGGITFVPSGCARMLPPSGGPKDSIPPVLVKAQPKDSMLHVPLTGVKITLNFDEYIQLDNASQNLLVNPTMKMIPIVESRLKTITVRIKDTLEPNTTYSLNFGNAIKDVNEGNILRHFTYLFSTGSNLDSGTLFGKVSLARNSRADSTLLVILHRNHDDSAVAKETPRYVARLDSLGRFRFRHIATGEYSIYALKDVGDKKYHDKSELFAFYDHAVTVTPNPGPADSIFLFAYAELPPKPKAGNVNPAPKKNAKKVEQKLHVSVSLNNGKQDLLSPLYIQYDQPIAKIDTPALQLTDTFYRPLAFKLIVPDTTRKKFGIDFPWKEDSVLKLIIGKTFATDTSGVTIGRSDTLTIHTQKESDYGSLTLRLHHFDLSLHPVIQFVQTDKVVDSIPVTGPEIVRTLYHPGEYELRVLYDTNQNGTWDPGSFFGLHRQPEIVVRPKIPKIKVRGNGWENEYDVNL